MMSLKTALVMGSQNRCHYPYCETAMRSWWQR